MHDPPGLVVVCEPGYRWTAALRSGLTRRPDPAGLCVRRIEAPVAAPASPPPAPALVALAFDPQRVGDALAWVRAAATIPRVGVAALCPTGARGSLRVELEMAFREAGALEWVDTPLRVGPLLEAAERFHASQWSAWRVGASPAEWAWRLLPWQREAWPLG